MQRIIYRVQRCFLLYDPGLLEKRKTSAAIPEGITADIIFKFRLFSWDRLKINHNTANQCFLSICNLGNFLTNIVHLGIQAFLYQDHTVGVAKGSNTGCTAKDELEGDVRDMGQEIDHVVLPFQKAREVVVFLKGREEYYKLSLDRGTAVQSEDMARMLNYLDEAQLKVSYVDLRVEGRAYYK